MDSCKHIMVLGRTARRNQIEARVTPVAMVPLVCQTFCVTGRVALASSGSEVTLVHGSIKLSRCTVRDRTHIYFAIHYSTLFYNFDSEKQNFRRFKNSHFELRSLSNMFTRVPSIQTKLTCSDLSSKLF